MIINQIVSYCKENYSKNGQCKECQNECRGGCGYCLNDILWNGKIQRYNCSNIVNFYVCRYIYRFASEIEYILDKVGSLNQLDRLDILSIGCGPSTDLLGIINFLEKNNDEREIIYTGYDLNLYWKPINDKIKLIVENGQRSISTRYIYDDFSKIINGLYLNSQNLRIPNILILQYVISDMLMFFKDINSFIDNLISYINNYMPQNSFIIINDINLGRDSTEPRYYYDILEKKINPLVVFKNHFKINGNFFCYGNQHPKNKVLYDIPDNISDFDPWDTCRSAQIVLQKG